MARKSILDGMTIAEREKVVAAAKASKVDALELVGSVEYQAKLRVERQLAIMVNLFGIEALEAIVDGAQQAVREWVPEELAR